MIRGIIVEDEKHSRETLRGMLDRYCKNVDILAEAESYRGGLEAIKLHQPDVVFLDIQMPGEVHLRGVEEPFTMSRRYEAQLKEKLGKLPVSQLTSSKIEFNPVGPFSTRLHSRRIS